MFRFLTFVPLGGMLYPWWLWMTAMGITRHRLRCLQSPEGNIKSNQITPHCLQRHSATTRLCTAKYRGFRRMLRCLTIDTTVARPAMNGRVRYSSDRSAYDIPPSAHGKTLRSPSNSTSRLSRAVLQLPVRNQQTLPVVPARAVMAH
jgi:hypothetical protein